MAVDDKELINAYDTSSTTTKTAEDPAKYNNDTWIYWIYLDIYLISEECG